EDCWSCCKAQSDCKKDELLHPRIPFRSCAAGPDSVLAVTRLSREGDPGALRRHVAVGLPFALWIGCGNYSEMPASVNRPGERQNPTRSRSFRPRVAAHR